MLAVLEAFAVIGVVVAVGAIVGRRGVLGGNARMVLNRVAFHIGVPALLLLNLSEATLDQIFSPGLVVSAVATLLAFAACFVVFTVLRRRSRGDSTIASWTASYVNAGNLGIPLSAYVFGSTTEVSAIILFQCVVMAPIGIAVLNSAVEPRPSARKQVLALVVNPIVVASAVGIAFAAAGVHLAGPAHDSVRLLADLAIPTVLLAFGISLGDRADALPRASRGDLAIVVVFKLVLMPVLAYAVARWGFDASPEQIVVVTVLAALPSAQNINAYASVYRCNESLARDATLVSTVIAVPIIAAIVALLSG